MEKISVIIPAYNAESTIQRCIESILSQSFQDFCIYVVDDCSTDKTWDLLCDMANKDVRIKIFRTEQNGGPSIARNIAIGKSAGEWLSFIDSDDYIDNNYYSELIKHDKSADIVIGSFIQVDKSGKYLRDYPATEEYKADTIDAALNIAYGGKDDLNFVYNLCCNKIYRKSLFKNVSFPPGRLQEDAYVMPFLIYNISKRIETAKEAIYYYVDDSSSISHQGQQGISDLKRRMDLIYMYISHIDLYVKNNNPLYKRSRANLLNNIISIYKLHYNNFCISNQEYFKYLRKCFTQHFYKAFKESNPYISKKLLCVWTIFVSSPKTYLKIFNN